MRRFGRGDYSYQAGEPLSDYLVQMDITDQDKPRSERFEINHHSYRLPQSRCYLESEEGLRCTTCHDPHSKVPEESRAEFYRSRCLQCHEAGDYQRAHAAAEPAVSRDDCVSCHMQKRRAQDVVHVAVTDHLIRRKPGGPELLAPLREVELQLAGVEVLKNGGGPQAPESEIYMASALIRASGKTAPSTVDRLQGMLAVAPSEHAVPYMELTRGQMKQRRFAEAERSVITALGHDPNNPLAGNWLGVTLIGQNKLGQAIEKLSEVLKDDPNHPEAHFNLGLALFGLDRDEEALEQFQLATELRLNMVPAWYYLGRVNDNLNRAGQAIASYRRALEIEPAHTRSHSVLFGHRPSADQEGRPRGGDALLPAWPPGRFAHSANRTGAGQIEQLPTVTLARISHQRTGPEHMRGQPMRFVALALRAPRTVPVRLVDQAGGVKRGATRTDRHLMQFASPPDEKCGLSSLR
jgi:tetratricopeptide (TPR) repeat protein